MIVCMSELATVKESGDNKIVINVDESAVYEKAKTQASKIGDIRRESVESLAEDIATRNVWNILEGHPTALDPDVEVTTLIESDIRVVL